MHWTRSRLFEIGHPVAALAIVLSAPAAHTQVKPNAAASDYGRFESSQCRRGPFCPMGDGWQPGSIDRTATTSCVSSRSPLQRRSRSPSHRSRRSRLTHGGRRLRSAFRRRRKKSCASRRNQFSERWVPSPSPATSATIFTSPVLIPEGGAHRRRCRTSAVPHTIPPNPLRPVHALQPD